MPVVQCSCGARLKAREEAAGKRVKCPRCGNKIPVPAEPAPVIVASEPSPLDLLETLTSASHPRATEPVSNSAPSLPSEDDIYGLADGEVVKAAPQPVTPVAP